MFGFSKKIQLPTAEVALKGRVQPVTTSELHFVNHHPLKGPYPENFEKIVVGMGCFWGVERIFWKIPGVYVTAAGYAAGFTPNPTYEEVCSGQTGHNEVVLVVFDPHVVSLEKLIQIFWEGHNPTQGMRQGNDQGTQYRSGLYVFNDEQKQLALSSKALYQKSLSAKGYSSITTEILDAGPFYFAEDYHQQYLAKNPNGYCGIGGTGVSCPVGFSQETV